jgi:SAM-dependent methyltransferase
MEHCGVSVSRDERTELYFETLTPSYSPGRYRPILHFLRKNAAGKSSLLDVGCGSGNVLAMIHKQTPVSELAGLDISPRYLEQCASSVPGCRTHEGSILDASLTELIGRQYRYVMVGAILHHLVGGTRRKSRDLAALALENAWGLVEPGGALIVMEPTFRPRWLMWALFHVKRVVGRLTSRRVPLLGYWNNIGEPVVSYYSHAQMKAALEGLSGKVIVAKKREKRLPLLWRLAGLTERADSILIVRKHRG